MFYNLSMKKNVLVNFRIEEELKDSFAQIVESQGFTMSEVITASIKDIVSRKKIPINILTKLNRESEPVLSIPFIKAKVQQIIDIYFPGRINSVALFGSYACGTQTKNSDIDLLLDAQEFGMRDLGTFKTELQSAFKKDVDIAFKKDDDSYFMKVVNKEKIVIYERS